VGVGVGVGVGGSESESEGVVDVRELEQELLLNHHKTKETLVLNQQHFINKISQQLRFIQTFNQQFINGQHPNITDQYSGEVQLKTQQMQRLMFETGNDFSILTQQQQQILMAYNNIMDGLSQQFQFWDSSLQCWEKMLGLTPPKPNVP